jgi:hypothetical protein
MLHVVAKGGLPVAVTDIVASEPALHEGSVEDNSEEVISTRLGVSYVLPAKTKTKKKNKTKKKHTSLNDRIAARYTATVSISGRKVISARIDAIEYIRVIRCRGASISIGPKDRITGQVATYARS